jgi:hypothetical protein
MRSMARLPRLGSRTATSGLSGTSRGALPAITMAVRMPPQGGVLRVQRRGIRLITTASCVRPPCSKRTNVASMPRAPSIARAGCSMPSRKSSRRLASTAAWRTSVRAVSKKNAGCTV